MIQRAARSSTAPGCFSSPPYIIDRRFTAASKSGARLSCSAAFSRPVDRRTTMPDPLVLYEVDDKVVTITLNRPEKLNAISPQLQQQLTEAFVRADADPATSVV